MLGAVYIYLNRRGRWVLVSFRKLCPYWVMMMMMMMMMMTIPMMMTLMVGGDDLDLDLDHDDESVLEGIDGS